MPKGRSTGRGRSKEAREIERAVLALTETDWYGPMERECVACWSAPYPCTTLRLLAQPYAGRPGWHNEWTTT